MRKFIITISVGALLAFVVWWDRAEKEIRVPEEVLKTIPECVLLEALQGEQAYSQGRLEELGQVAKECGDAKIDYFLTHRNTAREFLQPPYVLQ